MKLLNNATLFAIFMKCISASYIGWGGLCDAIDEGKLEIALKLCKENNSLCEGGVSHVIKRGDSDIIADFINQTNQVNARTLEELWKESSVVVIENVLGRVSFSQKNLIDEASSIVLLHNPEKFIALLNKIEASKDQESVIVKGIEELFTYGYSSYVNNLFDFLKGKTFRNNNLEDIAVQKAFKQATLFRSFTVLGCIFDHSAITPKIYANELIAEESRFAMGFIVYWLLERADRYDLQAVKENKDYASLGSNFHATIEEALRTAKPGGTRNHDIERAKIAKEMFKKLEHSGVPKVIADLIGSYLAE